MNTLTPNDPELALALARFTVIAPLLPTNLHRSERSHRRREILARRHPWPDGTERRVPQSTLERWLQTYRQGGLDALKPQTRRDRGTSRRIPEDVLLEAIRLRQELPTRSSQHLVNMLTFPIAAPTLRRMLAARGYSRKALAAQGRAYPRYEQIAVNDVWQSDAMHGLYLPDPLRPGEQRKTYLLALLDDHSRFVIHAQYYWSEGVLSLQDLTRQAILRGGLPNVIYTDNGAAYRSNQFAAILARLGIRLIQATPYCPQGKGKTERFWWTLQQDFQVEAERAAFSTLDELNTALWAWVAAYHERIHSSLEETPQQRWLRFADRIRRVDLAELAKVWLWKEVRQVDKSGLIHLQGNAYQVMDGLVGQKVELRYDPVDLSQIQVWFQGQRFPQAQLHTLQNQTAKGVLSSPEASRLLPLASARAYHEGQIRLQREQLTQQLGELAPSVGPELAATLHAQSLLALCTDLLAPRALTPGETEQVNNFVGHYGILDAQRCHRLLQRAIASKGVERPLAYYLDAVVQTMLPEGRDDQL